MHKIFKRILFIFFIITSTNAFALSQQAIEQKQRFFPNTEKMPVGIVLHYGNDFKCSNDLGKYAKGCNTQGLTKIEYIKSVINTYIERMPNKGKKVVPYLKKNKATMLLFNTFDDMEVFMQDEEVEWLGTDNFQDMYADETVVSNNSSKGAGVSGIRNATMEETLHLIHNFGITPAYPKWQKRLEKATTEALQKNMLHWDDKNGDGVGDDQNELPRQDLDDEYLTGAVEAYYNQRDNPAYIRQESLCTSSRCSQSSTLQDLKKNHYNIYILIKEMFGGKTKFYKTSKAWIKHPNIFALSTLLSVPYQKNRLYL